MKTFYVMRNKDSADRYVTALLSAGYVETSKIGNADFLLIDHEHKGERFETIKTLVEKMPVFIYPHVPYAYWIWDGIYEPLKVSCNFVESEGAAMGMKSYRYPARVEVVGFTGCEVQSFKPTNGTNLLFAPAHLLSSGGYGYPTDGFYKKTQQIAEFLAYNINRFSSVIVRYSGDLRQCGLGCFEGSGAVLQNIEPYKTPNIRQIALAEIDKADIVISCNTFGYLSIARGKPTLLYGYKDLPPGSLCGVVKSYEKYKVHYDFPLYIEDMTVADILDMRLFECARISEWKRINIGTDFDADKFLEVVREFV